MRSIITPSLLLIEPHSQSVLYSSFVDSHTYFGIHSFQRHISFFFFSRAKKGRVERYARRVVRKQRACPCSLVFETTKKATISVQTAIATKTAMSFWDSVTTGAQNAAETTKLVSIVRPLSSPLFVVSSLPFPIPLHRDSSVRWN